jgi:translation initiation factor IF-2
MANDTTFKKVRLFKVSKELNISIDTIVQYLIDHGHGEALTGAGVNAAITDEVAYQTVLSEFAADKAAAARVQELKRERADYEERMEPEAPAAPEPVIEPEPVVEPTPVPAPPPPEAEVEKEPEPPVATEPATQPAPEPVIEPAAQEQVPDEVEEVPTPVAGDLADTPSLAAEQQATIDAAREQQEPELAEAEADQAEAEVVDEPEAKVEAEPDDRPEDEVVVADAAATPEAEPPGVLTADRYKLTGTTVLGRVDLASLDENSSKTKRKRKRKPTKAADTTPAPAEKPAKPATAAPARDDRDKKSKKKKRGPQVNEADVEQSLQETLRELEQGASRLRSRRRRDRRQERSASRDREAAEAEEQGRVLRITEFVSTGELANLMNVPVTDVISTLFSAGMIVSINQRLDADTITIVADEYDFEVEFITDFGTQDIVVEADSEEDLKPRAPVVTIMGHVDHGKTSLLDYIRKANVVAGEAGGITQHIGAYHVEVQTGRTITFLDTPGHEAFTAMRARGAKVTDVVILVVSADDAVMPQTVEAINHARAAEVPIIVAINKIDKGDANPERVIQQLSEQNILVEQWGGKVQCGLVSAKTGQGVDDLLVKVLFEAELMDLKANPDRRATGAVIESRLDKGRGVVATVLVQNGTLHVGDIFVCGIHSGRVRAMFDERDQRIDNIGPARPALILGLSGAPEVGDQLVVFEEERDAREIAQRRQQIHREQSLRQRKHITLDEIGRRLALGEFRELNLIVKADVGGSVEALSDSLLKLSTAEVAVNIIHSGVGAVNDSDVMLASASDAVIIGFQVRPTANARAIAEREEIDVRTYSIIYDAISDVRAALEGLLSPEKSERILGVAEVRETFKVPRIGTVAGCYVTEGKLRRSDRTRLVREGVVIYTGGLSSLKRFKDDVREVTTGYECGMGIENYNDIKVGDHIEAFEIIETRRKLEA